MGWTGRHKIDSLAIFLRLDTRSRCSQEFGVRVATALVGRQGIGEDGLENMWL